MSLSSSETFSPSSFVTGDVPIVTEPETIAAGQNLSQYAALGRITASGKWVLSDPGAGDGSEVIRGFLPVAVDATGGDTTAPVYKAGQFNPEMLVFGGAHNAASAKKDIEGTPLFLRAQG